MADRYNAQGAPAERGVPPFGEEETRGPVRCDCNTRARHLGTRLCTQPCSQRCSMMVRALARLACPVSARKSPTERRPAHSAGRPTLSWCESWRMIAYRKPSAEG